MELIEIVGKLIERDPLSGIVLTIFVIQWFMARNAERDDQNTSNAIALASAVVTTFQPVQTALEKLIERINVTHDETQQIVTGAAQESRLAHQVQLKKFEAANETMTTVSTRRDEQYSDIVRRLETQQQQLADLSKKIAVASIQENMRGDITRLVFLATGIRDDFNLLIPKITISQPGESKKPTPEAIQEKSNDE